MSMDRDWRPGNPTYDDLSQESLWDEPFMGSDAVIRQRNLITDELRETEDQEMKGVQ